MARKHRLNATDSLNWCFVFVSAVVFQLLAFSSMTIRATAEEMAIPVRLSWLEDTRSLNFVMICCSDAVFKVTVKQTKGLPSEITVRQNDNEDTTTFKATPGNNRKAMDDFAQFLKDDSKKRTAEKSRFPVIAFEFEEAVQYAHVMKLIDEAKGAGFEKVQANVLEKKSAEK